MPKTARRCPAPVVAHVVATSPQKVELPCAKRPELPGWAIAVPIANFAEMAMNFLLA
jgi:hypothetical protein